MTTQRTLPGTDRDLTAAELEAGLDHILQSPDDEGVLRLIVCRPRAKERRLLETAQLTCESGLAGDCWSANGRGDPETQVTLMNARAIALIAGTPDRWALAGDQLYVDFDLSGDNVPPGTRLAVGTAILEVTAEPHTGCRNFKERFGADALRFVNSPVGRQLNLRGINARVLEPGDIRVGDAVCKRS